ncbi:hypothetical protein [Zavarzinia sp. CC-PAN008]|uniref:hypothetical protein n=1 Tax=Zavarzinia sp. CC-PAN008 TaxID=3243332 RepID=UPI003F744375
MTGLWLSACASLSGERPSWPGAAAEQPAPLVEGSCRRTLGEVDCNPVVDAPRVAAAIRPPPGLAPRPPSVGPSLAPSRTLQRVPLPRPRPAGLTAAPRRPLAGPRPATVGQERVQPAPIRSGPPTLVITPDPAGAPAAPPAVIGAPTVLGQPVAAPPAAPSR